MEKNQEAMKKKSMSTKIVTSTSAGGLAGIILLGGALVTAALVSTFAFKVKQKFNKPSKVVKEDSDKILGDEGLSFLVSDSRPSHGTGSEIVSRETAILDESREVNGGKDEEFDVLEKASEGLLCDESVSGMEEIPVLVADGSLLLKPDGMKNNDLLEENAVIKADETIMMADSDEVRVVDDDQHILLEEDEVCDETGKNIDGNNKLADHVDEIERVPAEKCNETREVVIEREEALVEVFQCEQLGIDYEYHKLGDEYDGNGQILVEKREEVVEVAVVEKCNETREVVIERDEVLVEVLQSEKLGIDYEYHKLGEECDGNGQIFIEKREEVVEVAVENKIRADDDLYKGGEESDDDIGVTIERGEVLVGDVAANGIQSSEESESSTMYGDQDIHCSDGTIIHRHETGSCDVKKTDFLLPKMDSSSLLKPAGKDHVENLLVIEETTILEEEEENETEESIEVEESGETHLVKANDENKICREITNDKSEDADEIGVENDQQMQPCEEYQKNLIDEDQKYISVESSPDNNSFQCNGCEEQEFSFPLLDSPPYFNFGNLIKNDLSETALHVDVKPLVQSAKNDEMKRFSDGSENDALEGEETLEIGLVDIGQETELSEQYNFNNGSKNDEEVLEIIQTENFEIEKNQQTPSKENSYYGGKDNIEEEINGDFANEEEEENSDSDEEGSVDGSSESTGDSSLDFNVEAIWPVESVQEFSEEIVDSNNYMETERVDSNVNFNRRKLGEEDKDSFDRNFCNKFTAEITTLRRPTNFFSLKFLFLSLVVPFLLVLWLLSSQISSSGLYHSHLQ